MFLVIVKYNKKITSSSPKKIRLVRDIRLVMEAELDLFTSKNKYDNHHFSILSLRGHARKKSNSFSPSLASRQEHFIEEHIWIAHNAHSVHENRPGSDIKEK